MEDFFQRVLPVNGDYVVVAIRPDVAPGHPDKARDIRGIKDQAALVAAVRDLSTEALDLYVAVGSYDGHRKKPLAKQTLFLDLDAKHFADRDLTKEEQADPAVVFPLKAAAARELAIFCRSTGFPSPGIINDSGGGLHCYWPFIKAIDIPTWTTLAEALKAKCKAVGFRADHPITADTGRVLRIPTTLNHKYGTPVPCRTLRDTGECFDPVVLLEQLGGPVDDAFEGVGTPDAAPANAIDNSDLSGGLVAYDKPSDDVVRDMLRYVDIKPGDGQWSRILSSLHDWSGGAPDGFAVFHDWSKAQPGYVSERDCAFRWRSFGKGGGISRRPVTIATLIMMAKEAGWEPPPKPDEDEETREAEETPSAEESTQEPVSTESETDTLVQTGLGFSAPAFRSQIAAGTASVQQPPAGRMAAALGLQKSKAGIYYASVFNVSKVLDSQYTGQIWYDEFLGKILTTMFSDTPQEWTDVFTTNFAHSMQASMKLHTIGDDIVLRSVIAFAHANTRNCVKEYVEALQWDGTKRLTKWLTSAFGVQPSRYHMRAGRNFLISMIARVLDPGCKADCMLVLEGRQGLMKSSALKVLGGDWFGEVLSNLDSKDGLMEMEGIWIGEVAELGGMRRADVDRIKAVLSQTSFRYRPPYGRTMETRPRRGVLAGTVNRSDWHQDDTGGRRFWPVACQYVYLQWLRANRDQLFAEAAAEYTSGRRWWFMPQAETESVQADRTTDDPWGIPVGQYIDNKVEVDSDELLGKVLQIPSRDQTRQHQTRIGVVMRQFSKFKKVRKYGAGGGRQWVWRAEELPSPLAVQLRDNIIAVATAKQTSFTAILRQIERVANAQQLEIIGEMRRLGLCK